METRWFGLSPRALSLALGKVSLGPPGRAGPSPPRRLASPLLLFPFSVFRAGFLCSVEHGNDNLCNFIALLRQRGARGALRAGGSRRSPAQRGGKEPESSSPGSFWAVSSIFLPGLSGGSLRGGSVWVSHGAGGPVSPCRGFPRGSVVLGMAAWVQSWVKNTPNWRSGCMRSVPNHLPPCFSFP